MSESFKIQGPWRLFLDDDSGKPGMESFRNPPVGETDWRVSCSSASALIHVIGYGIPYFMDLDHDLGMLSNGKQDTAIKFLKDLEAMYPDAILEIKGYRVHSKNPVGAENIRAFMDSWRRSKELP